MSPTEFSVSTSGIKSPKVTKAETADDALDVLNDNLPLGVLLTGGAKLRKNNLTGKGVRVAVIDSGVDAEHEGFNGRVTKQMWFRYGSPLSQDDHGTHVAGTIHMLAPDAEIYDYRVFGDIGFPVDEAIVTCIFEACFDGVDIINMSLGGRWPTNDIRAAIKYAHSKGVIVVCAAGNEGDDNILTNERYYPAMWEEAICVAALTKSEDLPVAYFSNTNPQVDYAGIGVNVTSFKPDGGFQGMSGTSMACPHVCGLLSALLDKQDGYLNGEEVAVQTSFCGLGGSSVEGPVKGDAYLRKMLEEKYLIDIGVKGADNATGLGFLTYLTKNEFYEMWKTMP